MVRRYLESRQSLIDYLNNKSWLVRDYEEIIFHYVNFDNIYNIIEYDYEIICKAKKSYIKRLNKKKKLKKFLDKFRRNKNGK